MKAAPQKKGNVIDNIKKLEQQREERRMKLEEQKQAKADRNAYNKAMGKNCDVEFDLMIDQNKSNVPKALNHVSSSQMLICVCVRKRPLFDKEFNAGEIDCVTSANPRIVVHECKVKVDGITKYVEDNEFKFDNTYDEVETAEIVYEYQIKALLPRIFNKGVVTCFAYGQTGSGKTYTMSAVTKLAIKDLFVLARQNKAQGVNFFMSFFEIYGGKVMDLLNGKKKLQILEDKHQRIQVQGLEEKQANSDQEMLDIINFGHSVRTTHQTVANDTSSRSHAICQVNVRDANGRSIGKLLLVDLAGSERAQDTQSNNRQRRMEGAEINKSLLALKECIRALDTKSSHVPFRASKLTMVLRDSFLNEESSKIVMIACINPGSTSADHTINTLRYAQRLKSNISNEYNNPAQLGFQQQNQPPPQQQQKLAQQQPSVQSKEKLEKFQQDRQQPEKQQPPQKQAEEKKRAQWGNPTKDQAKAVDKPPKQQQQNKSNNRGGGGSSSDETEQSPVMKQKKKEDWNYLKQTLNMGQGQQLVDQDLLTFHEKVDRIVDEEEELRNKHLQYLKEAAQLLTEEGELISNVQGIGNVEYDIDEYVNRMERIITRNIEIYSDLQKRMNKFKKHLKEEEEAHQNVKQAISRQDNQNSQNIIELLKAANLDQKDQIYEYELIQFLKKQYQLPYQIVSQFTKSLKGPENADKPYICKKELINQLGYGYKTTHKDHLYTSSSIQKSCNLEALTNKLSTLPQNEISQSKAIRQPLVNKQQQVCGQNNKSQVNVKVNQIGIVQQSIQNLKKQLELGDLSKAKRLLLHNVLIRPHMQITNQSKISPSRNSRMDPETPKNQKGYQSNASSSSKIRSNLNSESKQETNFQRQIRNINYLSPRINDNQRNEELLTTPRTDTLLSRLKFNTKTKNLNNILNSNNQSPREICHQLEKSFHKYDIGTSGDKAYSLNAYKTNNPKNDDSVKFRTIDFRQADTELTKQINQSQFCNTYNKNIFGQSFNNIDKIAFQIDEPHTQRNIGKSEYQSKFYQSAICKSNSRSRPGSFIRASPRKQNLDEACNLANKVKQEDGFEDKKIVREKACEDNELISSSLDIQFEKMKQKFSEMNQRFDQRHKELFQAEICEQIDITLQDNKNEIIVAEANVDLRLTQQNNKQIILIQSESEIKNEQEQVNTKQKIENILELKDSQTIESLQSRNQQSINNSQYLKLKATIEKSGNTNSSQAINQRYNSPVKNGQDSLVNIDDSFVDKEQYINASPSIKQKLNQMRDQFGLQKIQNDSKDEIKNSICQSTRQNYITSSKDFQKQICDSKDSVIYSSKNSFEKLRSSVQSKKETQKIAIQLQDEPRNSINDESLQDNTNSRRELIQDKIKNLKERLLTKPQVICESPIKPQVSNQILLKEDSQSLKKPLIIDIIDTKVKNTEDPKLIQDTDDELMRTYTMDINESFGGSNT